MAEDMNSSGFQDELEIDGEVEPYIVSVLDEDNVEHKFEMIDAIETDTDRYLALLPVFDNVTDIIDDDGDLVILKVLKDGDEEILVTIDDEEEFEEIVGIFEERLSELFDFEEDDDYKNEF